MLLGLGRLRACHYTASRGSAAGARRLRAGGEVIQPAPRAAFRTGAGTRAVHMRGLWSRRVLRQAGAPAPLRAYSHRLHLKNASSRAMTTRLSTMTVTYPYSQESSGMLVKFMPYQPVMVVMGTNTDAMTVR